MCYFERICIYLRKVEIYYYYWNEFGFLFFGWLNILGIWLGLIWIGRLGGYGFLIFFFFLGCFGYFYFFVWGKNFIESMKVLVFVVFKFRD